MLDNLICLEQTPLKLCVDANLGGHIIEFSLDGANALASDAPEIGSTFWPSPQQAWDWPPPKTLDKAPYQVIQRAPTVELVSSVCDITGLQVSKTFTLNATQLVVDYTMANPGAKPLNFAPWEISRIEGGLTFYRSDEPPLGKSTGTAINAGGYVWHEYLPEQQEQNQKVFGNGSSGWLANANEGLLLVKQFAPLPEAAVAPGEAEVEIYGHGDSERPYIEVEQQGPYQVIAPGEKLHWQVTWRLFEIPGDINVELGNVQLPQWLESKLRSAEAG